MTTYKAIPLYNFDDKLITLSDNYTPNELYTRTVEIWGLHSSISKYDFPFIKINKNTIELTNGWAFESEKFLLGCIEEIVITRLITKQ